MTVLDPGRWRRLQPILDRALNLRAGERRAFIARACRGDPDLRADVEAVLRADTEAGRVLDAPTGGFLEAVTREFERTRTHATGFGPTMAAHVERVLLRVLRERSAATTIRAATPDPPRPGETARFLPGMLPLPALAHRRPARPRRDGRGLKFLPAGLERDPRRRERLLDEVRIARQDMPPSPIFSSR